MDLGKLILQARKARKMTQTHLGEAVGLSKSQISSIELNEIKTDLSPKTTLRFSHALSAPSLLTSYCQACPIRAEILPRQFEPLNRIKRDLAVIAGRLGDELEEAVDPARVLAQAYASLDFAERPDYREMFFRNMEQIIDAIRAAEELVFELLISGVHTQEDLEAVYRMQQEKCIRKGHHRPELTAPAAP